MADVVVSGAGSTAVNGTYAEGETVNGKPSYTKGDVTIQWELDGELLYWGMFGNGYYYYASLDDTVTPDLATTWEIIEGAEPAPTVTAAAAGGFHPINMNAQMQSLTGGMRG